MNNYYRNTAEFYTLAKYSGNNELMHYGVLCMKWGKRKAKAEWQAAAKKYRSSNTKEDNDAYDRAADKYRK